MFGTKPREEKVSEASDDWEASAGECEDLRSECRLRKYNLVSGDEPKSPPYRVVHAISSEKTPTGNVVPFDVYYPQKCQRSVSLPIEAETAIGWGVRASKRKEVFESDIRALKAWMDLPPEKVVKLVWETIGPQAGFPTLKDAEDYLETISNPERHLTYYDAQGKRLEEDLK